MRRAVDLATLVLIVTALAGAASRAEEDTAVGEKLFNKCKACHSLEAGVNKVGPTLFGIFGRAAGMVEGFKYSDAMVESGVVWDEATINQYITKPKEFIPGNKMTFPGLKDDDDRMALIAYLKQMAQPQ